MIIRPARSIRNIIPNFLTILNLLSGCMAILVSFHDIALAGIMVLLAGVFDFTDGLTARILDAYSDFGKELDSLADIVSFGVAPSFIMFHLISSALIADNHSFNLYMLSVRETVMLSASFLPVVFAAIRLASFNLSAGKVDLFSGLPSPAAGIFIASAGYILFTTDSLWIRDLLNDSRVLLSVSISISLLMVIPLPMFNIKFSNFSFTGNRIRYLLVLPSFIVLVYWGLTAIPFIIIYYVLLSAIHALFSRAVPAGE